MATLYDATGKAIEITVTEGGSGELVNKFANKNIVWIGDSIHAYATPDGVTVPYLFQYHSGAKCFNWCQGGMTMAKTGVTNYDPYSGVGMIDAIVSRDFTDQETYAGEGHGTAQGNFYEQVAEMQELDFSTVDAIIIEYGTNDALKDVTLDNEEDVLDTTTTGGALRYMIKTLQTAYPKLNIAVCNVQPMSGYLDAEHQKLYDSIVQTELINQICDELNIPLIDIYNDLGLNDYTKSTLLHDGLHRTHDGKLKQVNLIENKMVQYF